MSFRQSIESLLARHSAIVKTYRGEETKLREYWDVNNEKNPYSNEERIKRHDEAIQKAKAAVSEADKASRQEFRNLIVAERSRLTGMTKRGDDYHLALANPNGRIVKPVCVLDR